jgi:hypothetical protein
MRTSSALAYQLGLAGRYEVALGLGRAAFVQPDDDVLMDEGP